MFLSGGTPTKNIPYSHGNRVFFVNIVGNIFQNSSSNNGYRACFTEHSLQKYYEVIAHCSLLTAHTTSFLEADLGVANDVERLRIKCPYSFIQQCNFVDDCTERT